MAAAATWHTLTQLLLHLVYATRAACPSHCPRGHDAPHLEDDAAPAPATAPVTATATATATAPAPAAGVGVGAGVGGAKPLLLSLTDGCIEDLTSLMETALLPSLCRIVGRGIDGAPLPPEPATPAAAGAAGAEAAGTGTHELLVAHGRRWAAHVNETWKTLVLAGAYVLLTATLEVLLALYPSPSHPDRPPMPFTHTPPTTPRRCRLASYSATPSPRCCAPSAPCPRTTATPSR